MVKMATGENQQPCVQQELDREFPSTRGESRELHRVGAGESSGSTITNTNTSFTTTSTIKRTIAEIWDEKLVETPNSIFFHVRPSDFRFVLRDCRLKFSEQNQKLSYFESFQSRPEGI